MATDWDMLALYTEDPERMQKVLDAFKPHCADSVLPRTLAPHLRQAGFDLARVSAYPIVNMNRNEQNYSTMMAPFIIAYIKSQGTVSEKILEAWEAELEELDNQGRYYFATNRIMFEVRRPA